MKKHKLKNKFHLLFITIVISFIGFLFYPTECRAQMAEQSDSIPCRLIFLDDHRVMLSDLETMLTDSISNFTVYKDAEALKKFGEEGANGVICLYSKAWERAKRNTFQFASFEGGDIHKFEEWLKLQVKYTPAMQKRHGACNVEISFLIDAQGYVSEISIPDSPNKSLEKQLISAFKNAPKWEPSIIQGEKVPVRLTIFIDFGPEPAENSNQ